MRSPALRSFRVPPVLRVSHGLLRLRRGLILAGLGVSLTLAGATAAQAGTSTLQLNLAASLFSDCLVAASPMAFGSVSGIAASSSTSTTVSLICTLGTPYTVAIGAGNGSGATTAQRYMSAVQSGTTYKLPYVVTQDNANAVNWGNTAGTDTVAGTGNGLIRTINAYGKLNSANTVPAGLTFTDTLSVTVNF